MPDREKVIKGLECCTVELPLNNNIHQDDFCKKCPYKVTIHEYCFGTRQMMRDALELLKEQEAVIRCKDCVHWDKGCTEECDNSDSVCFHNGWCKPDWFCADGEKAE